MSAAVEAFSPATVMVDALKRKTISPSELLDLHLERIRRLNPSLTAIVTFNAEASAQAAAAGDGGISAGSLHGLPVTIKDCIYTLGMPTTGGLAARADADT